MFHTNLDYVKMKMSALTHSMNYALLHTQYEKICYRKHFVFKMMLLYMICILSIDISISKSDIVIIMWDDCLLCVNLVFHVLFQVLT